jgi:ubiquinone/menaquinone biosynthesis C-methylase UbiE
MTRNGCASVLDVACGRGEALDIAREVGLPDVHGYEVIDYLCRRPDVTQIEGIHSLPAPDNSYDIVSCQDALEHILEEDIVPGIREMCRVARQKVLLSVAWFECQLGKSMEMELHITMHPEKWWLEKIEEAVPDGAGIMPAPTRIAQYEKTATLEVLL